jgi:hypothetical protein
VTATWLVAGYALFLLAAAWGFDLLARRASHGAHRWRSGGFVYHPDHDAWQCPTERWLWPTSFDPAHRVMRYRAKPVVCNTCPVKAQCTSSDHGREISRQVDPWPFSEAGRFHRGISCVVATLAMLMPIGQAVLQHTAADLLVLGSVVAITATASAPLFRHLWRTPVSAPEHVPHRTAHEDSVAAGIDRYSTRWGVGGVGTGSELR